MSANREGFGRVGQLLMFGAFTDLPVHWYHPFCLYYSTGMSGMQDGIPDKKQKVFLCRIQIYMRRGQKRVDSGEILWYSNHVGRLDAALFFRHISGAQVNSKTGRIYEGSCRIFYTVEGIDAAAIKCSGERSSWICRTCCRVWLGAPPWRRSANSRNTPTY